MLLILSVTLAKSWPGSTMGWISGWGTCTGGGAGLAGSASLASPGSSLAILQLVVRVLDLRQVRGARPRVQLAEQRVVPRLRLPLRDPAGRVVHVAEDDGLRRARRLAGGLDVAVADVATL